MNSKLRLIFIFILLLIIFLLYNFVEIYMHEQVHLQTAKYYGCEGEIIFTGLFTAHTLIYACDFSSEEEKRDYKLALSLQEMYYTDFIFHRVIIILFLFSLFGYIYKN